MDVILDRVASWAPRRQVFNLFSLNEYHIGTFSTLEYAIDCGRHYSGVFVRASFLDDPAVFETVWTYPLRDGYPLNTNGDAH